MKYKYTFGTTPDDVIAKQNEIDPFYMTLKGNDLDIFCEVITNEDWIDKAMNDIGWESKDLIAMLKQLFDSGSDTAWSLRSDILSVMNIEEI
jgi:hypothetical protein